MSVERTIPCELCPRKFADNNALWQHMRHRHSGAKRAKRAKPSRVFHRSDDNLAATYAMVDALDLPDGAHWALLEELTGLEPADFAFMGDDA